MGERFFSIKTKNELSVNAVLRKESSVEFSGLNVLADSLELGQIVFIVFGGDRPAWDTGLVAIAILSKLPYGYEGRNFKVRADIKVLLSNPIKRSDLVLYPETFDIIGIGPITKWEPNQALSEVQPDKAYALLNAIWDIDKKNRDEISSTFSTEQLAKIKTDHLRYKLIGNINKKENSLPVNSATNFDASKFINSLSLAGQYINSLLAKPFVILTGNSGTGKTRIAKRFAEYLKKENDAGKTNFLLVPVGADWTDNTKILGYYNPIANNGEGKYVKTEIFEFMERADANPEIPFFLILDEMNLSHVERYFSDFLSRMETPDSAFEIDNYKDGNLQFPGNLFITGTVNIDETTYMFSPKVLDRANVIEFKPEMDSVLGNLMDDSADVPEEEAPDGMAEGFMKLSLEIRKGRVTEELKENMKTAEKILAGFYPVLEKCGFEFAYRTVKEIRQYIVAAYKTCGDPASFKIDSTMDEQILQKVLPKIHGNKRQIGPMLDELERLCIEKDTADQDVTGTGWNLLLSLKKIRWMKDRLEKFQYVSFI
ncbi:MAG: AAA family ATPase [Treponema sp.]|nr:AAA family ATPase [Treponema sp.]